MNTPSTGTYDRSTHFHLGWTDHLFLRYRSSSNLHSQPVIAQQRRVRGEHPRSIRCDRIAQYWLLLVPEVHMKATKLLRRLRIIVVSLIGVWISSNLPWKSKFWANYSKGLSQTHITLPTLCFSTCSRWILTGFMIVLIDHLSDEFTNDGTCN